MTSIRSGRLENRCDREVPDPLRDPVSAFEPLTDWFARRSVSRWNPLPYVGETNLHRAAPGIYLDGEDMGHILLPNA